MGLRQRRLGALCFALALVPGSAGAQNESFDQLRKVLKPGDLVAVIDTAGAETQGRVEEVTAESLTLLEARWDTINRSVITQFDSPKRRFEGGSVAEVREMNTTGRRGSLLYRKDGGTFETLRSRLKTGTRVVLTDRTGRKTDGKVGELSPAAIELLTREPVPGGRGGTTVARSRTFAQSDVAEIRHSDGVRNGAAIGAGVGGGLGFLFLVGACEYGCSDPLGSLAGWIAAGGVVGAVIDASMVRRLVYSSSQTAASVRVTPVLSKGGRGVLVSMRF